MTLRQLEYFIEVAEQGSISVAARNLMISQPSLSQCIKKIEDELNVTLFDRSGIPMLPTKAGEVVLNKAHIIMTALEDIKKELSKLESSPKELFIGISDAGALINKHIFRAFQEECPGVKLTLVERDQYLLERMLEAGKLDMIFTMTPSDNTNLEVIPLVEDKFLIALPKSHPASQQAMEADSGVFPEHGPQVVFPTIHLSQCHDVHFVLSGRDRLKFAQLSALRSLPHPHIGFETDSLASSVAIAAYAPHGAIVPKMFCVLYDGPDRPCFFKCAEPLPIWSFALSLKKGSRNTYPTLCYVRLFTQYIQSLGLLKDTLSPETLIQQLS